MEKTSLEKSHSKVSNFKLTIICLLLCISVNGLFLAYCLRGKVEDLLWAILIVVFSVLVLINIALISSFKR